MSPLLDIIYLVLLSLAIVNAQDTSDPNYPQACGSDTEMAQKIEVLIKQNGVLREQSNIQVQQMLSNIQLILQQMQTNHVDQLTNLQNKYENITLLLNAILLQQRQDKTINDECASKLNASLFLDKPRLLGVTPGDGHVRRLTVLDTQLFVVRGNGSTQVNVYDTNNFTLTRNITITGSCNLWAIVSSPYYNCLYICDDCQRIIYRYNLSDNVITNWSVGNECGHLSLTSTQNVLNTLFYAKQINEYTPDGSLIREISLDSSIVSPWHSVQLSTGQFLVSHGYSTSLQRVCRVDTSGRVIQCYGGSSGSGVGQLNGPSNLAVDGYGNVLVTDWANNRVELLTPSLTHLGYITIPGYALNLPWALHLDQLTRRLYIGEDVSGRVIVLTV